MSDAIARGVSSSVDSRVVASFRVPFVGGTLAIAHSKIKPDPFKIPPTDLGIMGGVTGLAIGIIAGLSLCAMIKTAQFNHCATNGDPVRIAQCGRWLR